MDAILVFEFDIREFWNGTTDACEGQSEPVECIRN
jgi:hypothetical protein